jgi:hypothetical protein
MVQVTIQGTEFEMQRSNRKNKKLMATFTNKETGRENTVHFGDSRYSSYKDCSGLLPRSMIHGDKKRREAYRSRHRNDNLSKIGPGFLSWHCLW